MAELQTDSQQNNRNALWVDVLLQALRRAGVRRAVVSPGGRSAALVLGFARAGIEVTHVATDERAGGFFALGLARARGQAVAICVTSGSAVANLMPALTEADADGLPLIVLTADRLRPPGGGVPQTTDHAGLLAAAVGGSLELPEPEITAAALTSLRDDLALFLAPLADPALCKPLHVNVPLHGAFTSADAEPDWSPPANLPPEPEAEAEVRPPPAPPHTAALLGPGLPLRPGLRVLIVAGPDCPLDRDAADRLASRVGAPVLADLASGLRRPAIANLVTEGDVLALLPALQSPAPELVIRLGAAPLSLILQRYLAECRAPVMHIARRGQPDFLSSGRGPALRPNPLLLDEIAARLGPADAAYTSLWRDQAAALRLRLGPALAALPWGELQAAATACAAPSYGMVHIANSMSARHANLFFAGETTQQHTWMNRGINGIDGTVSTFLGELAGCGVHGLLLIGDQAMLHDLSGLEAATLPGLCGTICIVNNRGGSLLDLFGLNRVPDHERLIRNPTRIDFAAAAAAFGLPHIRCDSAADLGRALVPPETGVQIVEAMVPPGSLLRDLDGLMRQALGVG